MSKRINQYDSLDFERKVLYLTGVYCGKKFPNNAAFKIYRIINTSSAFLFLFLMAAKMIVERDNLELVFDVLHTFISQITLIIKAIYLCKVLPKYNALEERLTEPIFNQQTPDQDAIISENILGYKYAAFTLHGLAWVALVLYTICPIIEGPILAIPFWLPFGLDNYKMFVKIYEVLCTWTLSSGDPALDLLPVCLLSIGTAQLDILNQNLARSADRDPDDSYEVQEKKIRVGLKNCVQHHLAIIKYLDDVQDIFSFGMFIQIFTSVVAICMTGLQFISITPDSTVFFQVVTYFGCMLSQIYNVCWIGQKVITKSDEIRDACYMSAWETCCSSNKKTIFIFMERSKRVMMFRAGNFFTLSLATFVLIIRNAYSYFAVLVRVYKYWAVSTIMTRQNSIPSQDNKSQVNALIPLWDMCNHTNGNISTDYNPDLDRCECLAVRKFTTGEQLFIFYGPRSNADLLVHNGFVYEENQHDYYPLSLGISQSDALREKRLQLLTRLGIDNTVFKLRKDPQPIDGFLLAFLRIFNMNEGQLDHWLASDRSNDLQYVDCALDTVLEKKTWTFLQTRMKLLLAAYKTSLKEDEELIQKAPSSKETLPVRMVATEKRILTSVLEYAEQYVKQ